MYIHNRGRVNRRYLANVQPALASEYDSKEGTFLSSDQSYVVAALEHVLAAGVILSQLCWRAWFPEENAEADHELIETIYTELTAGRNLQVIRLGDLAAKLKLSDHASSLIINVNCAIAQRRLGNLDEVRAIVRSVDWSTVSTRYAVAKAVLVGSKTASREAIRRAIRAEELSQDELMEWPLFEELRKEDGFEVFLRSLIADDRKVELPPNKPLQLSAAPRRRRRTRRASERART